MQEDIARIRSDFEATTSFSRNSFAQFGPLKRLESTCGNDFDEDLLRLPELRRGTASGELWSQPRKILGGMTPMGERRYQYEEARICQRSLDLQRVGVSRYGQFFWDLDDHFQRQREARRLRLLGLQPRPFVEDAPGILDHGRMISTGDSFVAEARRINHHCNASKLKVQAGPTVSSSIPSSRLLTSSGLIRSSPTLADAETHCPLQSKVFTDAALLAAGRAVAEVAPERFSSSSDTRRRTLPHSDDDAEMSSVCGRASLLESSKGRENAAKGCNLSPQQQESTCLAKEKRTSRKAYPGDVDNLASTYPKGTEHLLSNEPSTDDLTVNNPIARLVKQYSAGGTKEAPFPLKLHAILANPEYHDIIGWLPHGNAWKIFQVSLFEQILVPRHFRHAKYASFMRQGK